MTTEKKPPDDHDSAWKEALLNYLPYFFELFFPDLFGQIDWRKKPKFMDKELQALVPATTAVKDGGRRTVDTLVELRWREGRGRRAFLVLVHIEIQAQKENDFAKRIFYYYARISERHDKPLCSLVILADRNRKWRPSKYASGFGGTSNSFSFPTVKLLDLWIDSLVSKRRLTPSRYWWRPRCTPTPPDPTRRSDWTRNLAWLPAYTILDLVEDRSWSSFEWSTTS